jgi:hypothetical protein
MVRSHSPFGTIGQHRTGSNYQSADPAHINAIRQRTGAVPQCWMGLAKVVVFAAAWRQNHGMVRPITMLFSQSGQRRNAIGTADVPVCIHYNEVIAANRRDRVRVLMPPMPNLTVVGRRR